jgi:hypothetical protein
MDFAFAPGTTGFDGYLRGLLSARSNTTLITKPTVTTVETFLKELVSSSLQGGDLIGGSHASDEGFLFLALDGTTAPLPVNWDMLVAVDTSKTINIPAAVKSPDTKFHFKGCSIGSDDSLPFLTLLKSALDNPQSVTAPKYFYHLGLFSKTGIFESMSYGYRLMSKTAYATRTALIDDYKAAGFTEELDGTPVPDANWSKWIKAKLALAPATKHKVQFDFPVTINPAAGGISAIPHLEAECRSRREHYTYVINGAAPYPTTQADRETFLKTTMSGDADFQSSHLYPVYQRLHFSDFDSFFDGFSWTFTVKGSTFNAVGTHFVYTVVVPILKPGTTDELIYNFYPAGGGAPVMNFLEDNAAFDLFGIV